MRVNWQYIPLIIIVLVTEEKSCKVKVIHNNWKEVEELAEQHPYIVALLDYTKNYSCTGSIINKRTILTSGFCVSLEPRFVAVGAAAFSSKSTNNILDVAYTTLHEDYSFHLKAADPNITEMHNNIGLVFVIESILQLYIPEPNIGNYYASELKGKIVVVIGYGVLIGSKVIGLQQQLYHQLPCSNRKWHYCICGTEYSSYSRAYNTDEFGKGAPVLLGKEIIGITASACGVLSFKQLNVKFNIFTVIKPYMPWISKTESNSMILLRTRSNSNCNKLGKSLIMFFIILMIHIKLFTYI